MLKVSTFLGETEFGPSVVPLFGPADGVFEKTASCGLLPEVLRFIDGLRPRKDAQYVLVNALGASEYFGSNVNADAFPEASLIHAPENWTGDPLFDKSVGINWPYGFPTFYGAHPFAHHRNKDPQRAFGEVELAAWNNRMKRVELVVRVDYEKCQRCGGIAVWDKLKAGSFADVSMGSKVPWDACSCCTDWKRYQEALKTFDPKRHRHPGMAVLEVHRKRPIRGISVTRRDYCEHMRTMPNRILPDGRKVFVYNFFPRFFDISFVFIGADRTAKVMVFISHPGMRSFLSPSSAEAAERLGARDPDEKTAAADDDLRLLFKMSEEKKSEIDKDVQPNLPPGKAVPLLTQHEPDLPKEVLQALRAVPMESALSTTAGLGIVLKPDEYDHVADGREDSWKTLTEEAVLPALARILLPLLDMRSSLGPFIERRAIVLCGRGEKDGDEPSSLSSVPLRKMSSGYGSYRRSVMNLIACSQNVLESAARPTDVELHKIASGSADELFTPLTFEYLNTAFVKSAAFGVTSERVVENSSQAEAGVQRGLPSKNTW